MFRMNKPLFPLLCGVFAIFLAGFPGISRAQNDDSSSPEIEVNRSVLDDLDGYTPPPMFGSPEKPALSRPLKSIPLPSLTGARATGGVSRKDDEFAPPQDGLSAEQIEENRQRGLAHPIIEETPPKKTVTRTTTGKRKPKEAPEETPPKAAAAQPVAPAPVKIPPLPIRKPAMAAVAENPEPKEKTGEKTAEKAPAPPPQIAAKPEKKPEIKPAERPATTPAAPAPEPKPESESKSGTETATKETRKQVIPPPHALMPALPPEKVEQENLGRAQSPAGKSALPKDIGVDDSQGDSGDITAYDASAAAMASANKTETKQKDISSSKAPGAMPPDRTPPKPEAPKAAPPPEKASPAAKPAESPKTPEPSKPPEASKPPAPPSAPASETAQPPGKSAITFEKGKSDLTPEQTDLLSSGPLSSLKAGDHYRVQIQAYATAADEGQSSARRVSLLRALSVRAWLVGQGIDPRRIDVRALGNQGGDSDTADRVDLIVFDPRNPP